MLHINILFGQTPKGAQGQLRSIGINRKVSNVESHLMIVVRETMYCCLTTSLQELHSVASLITTFFSQFITGLFFPVGSLSCGSVGSVFASESKSYGSPSAEMRVYKLYLPLQ